MSVTEQQTLAIEVLVRRRCDDLGLTQPELIRRCGYQNVPKGLRRLEQLRSGDFKKGGGLIDKLPAALEVPVDVIKQAVEDSQRYIREAEEAAWRAAFRPHGIIVTERQIPQPIFVAALIGWMFCCGWISTSLPPPPPLSVKPSTGSVTDSQDGTDVFRRSVGLLDSSSTTVRIEPSASILKEKHSKTLTAPIAPASLSLQ
jgi:hypothetical protein